MFGLDGGGIGALSIHPSNRFFAVAEKGTKPNIYVYDYPQLKVHRVLRKGTEKAYSSVSFRYATYLNACASRNDET